MIPVPESTSGGLSVSSLKSMLMVALHNPNSRLAGIQFNCIYMIRAGALAKGAADAGHFIYHFDTFLYYSLFGAGNFHDLLDHLVQKLAMRCVCSSVIDFFSFAAADDQAAVA